MKKLMMLTACLAASSATIIADNSVMPSEEETRAFQEAVANNPEIVSEMLNDVLAEEATEALADAADADGNGKIDRDEAHDMVDAMYDATEEADINGDGELDEGELGAAAMQQLAEVLADDNGDGEISEEELAQYVTALMDQNGDGSVQGAEMRAMMQSLFDQDANGEMDGEELGDAAQALEMLSEEELQSLIAGMVDRNGDGDTNVEEIMASLKDIEKEQVEKEIDKELDAIADELDTNGDGNISNEEILDAACAIAPAA
jgi:Ca2+-binding EF-hand superfamily protein